MTNPTSLAIDAAERPGLLARALAALKPGSSYASSEVTLMRALGAREHDIQLRNSDTFAERFLLGWHRLALPLMARLRPVLEWHAPGAYGYVHARTRHFDTVLTQQLQSGIDQLVILGAGNDSRAYRMRAQLGGVRTFEVDLPAPQHHKQATLRKMFGSLPAHVTYVSVDFERDSLAQRLTSAGFQCGSRTLFSWEGVSMFLTAEAVASTLTTLHDLSGPGSSVIFDYAVRSYVEGQHRAFYGGLQLGRWLRRHNIRYYIGFNAGEIDDFLHERGFSAISDLGQQELEHRYLSDANGQRKRRAWGQFRIVHAAARS